METAPHIAPAEHPDVPPITVPAQRNGRVAKAIPEAYDPRKPPPAFQRRTTAFGPVEVALEAIRVAYDRETALLSEGTYDQIQISMPSGASYFLTPSMRSFHRHGVGCVICSWRATHYLEKMRDKRAHAGLVIMDDPHQRRTTRLSSDHVIPRSLGGPSDPGNLVPLCIPCNSRKGSRETHERITRWRIRDLMEGLLAVCEPSEAEIALQRYAARRRLAFRPGRRANTIAALPEDAAREFLRWCGGSAADRANLPGIPSTIWPGQPLAGLAAGDPWLAAAAERISEALKRDARAPGSDLEGITQRHLGKVAE